MEKHTQTKEAEQRKNDLVVYLAHDLKTPLTSVIGYLSLLDEEKQISEELRSRYVQIALDKAERLEDLVDEFFEITRFNLTHISLGIIGLSGCGPTCLSMVLLALTEDEEATPYEVARFSEENGYYVEGSGTAWSLMTEGAA